MLIACFIYVIMGNSLAYSIILGGITFSLPNILFAELAVGRFATGSSNKALFYLYLGEFAKVILTIAMFAIIFLLLIDLLNIQLILLSYVMVLFFNRIAMAILVL